MTENVSLRVWGHGEWNCSGIQGFEPEAGASPSVAGGWACAMPDPGAPAGHKVSYLPCSTTWCQVLRAHCDGNLDPYGDDIS